MEAQSAPRRQLGDPKSVKSPTWWSKCLPKVFRGLSEAPRHWKNLAKVLYCRQNLRFAQFWFNMARGVLWNAFLNQLELSGEPLGQLFRLPRRLLGCIGGSWMRLGGPKMLPWRPKAASGRQLGGPKRPKTPTWRSKVGLRTQSAPRSQFLRPRALQNATCAPQCLNLEDQSI